MPELNERDRVQQRLSASLKENAQLCEAINEHAIVARTDASGKITFVNDKFCTISKYAREELIGQDHRIINSGHHPREFMRELWATIRAGRVWHGEIKNRAKDGSCYWVDTTIVPFLGEQGEPQQFVAIRTDITERKQAEEALQFSAARFASAFHSNPALWVDSMETGRLIDVNQRVCEFFGWQPAEVIGKTVGELGIWADPAEQRPVLDAVHATGAIRDREVRLCRRNGEVRDVLLSVEQAGLPRETERAMMIVFTDVTDRKKAENALQESEIRFSSFMEHSPIAGWIVDGEGRFRYLSPGYYRMFAVGDADLTGKLISEVYEPAVAERYLANNRMALEERRVVETVEKCLRPDGSTGEFMAVKFPIDGPDGVPLRGIEVDITERKKLEQQFLRSQRMESIGTLAGGIAHDLNNVLGPIIMSIDLLKMKFTDPGSLELLSLISSSAQRGAAMVSQVLSFARGVDGHKVHLQVKHVLRDIEKIANEIFPKNIQIRTKIPLELWTVEADPTQLHQVLLNLCVNARDAMPDGGRLTLTAENATIDAQYAGLEKEARPGPYVLLQVEDTGTGIAPEIIEQIFDPFFTTKEIGKGTGLGLSTTLAIVKSHGGFIRVYSELGAGTKFKLYLPAKTDVSPDAEADVEVELPRGRGELILVVDDEATVREITKETLEAFGYRVIVAADGAEAVGLLAERKKEVAAVLTDMTMPIMDGPATIQVMRRLSPQLPIVATSGLTANGHFARLGSLGVKHFLSKPYTAETLLQTMRQVLTPAPAIGCRF